MPDRCFWYFRCSVGVEIATDALWSVSEQFSGEGHNWRVMSHDTSVVNMKAHPEGMVFVFEKMGKVREAANT